MDWMQRGALFHAGFLESCPAGIFLYWCQNFRFQDILFASCIFYLFQKRGAWDTLVFFIFFRDKRRKPRIRDGFFFFCSSNTTFTHFSAFLYFIILYTFSSGRIGLWSIYEWNGYDFWWEGAVQREVLAPWLFWRLIPSFMVQDVFCFRRRNCFYFAVVLVRSQWVQARLFGKGIKLSIFWVVVTFVL